MTTRTDYAVVQNDSSEVYNLNLSDALLPINSTVVANGIRVTDAFGGKQDSLMLMVNNTCGRAKTMYVRKGGFDGIAGQGGFFTSSDDVDYIVPAGTSPYMVRIGKIESQVKNQNQSLCIDMESGLTGTFAAWNEAAHLDVGS